MPTLVWRMRSAVEALEAGIKETGSEMLTEYLVEVSAEYSQIEAARLAEVAATEEEADASGTQDVEEEQSVYYLVKETEYYSDGSIDYWGEYAYDAAGNQIKETQYYSDRSIDSWLEYEYEIR